MNKRISRNLLKASMSLLILCGQFCIDSAKSENDNASAKAPGTLVSQSANDLYVFMRSATAPRGAAYYNYVPDMIFDNGSYHLYWCGGMLGKPVNGDYILHAMSSSLRGPFHSTRSDLPNTFDICLQGTGSNTDFDGQHTCDPSVIKMGNVYYMYYGGLARFPKAYTAIGVAQSSDGIHFRRLNNGKPIVTAALSSPHPATPYGAGQPAVIYRAPYFYLSFSDTTGSGSNPVNGAGQFILRSPDPVFQRGVEELCQDGWKQREPGKHTAEYKFLEATSIDWMNDAPTGKIVLASDQELEFTRIHFIDPVSFASYGFMKLPGTWRDGACLLKDSAHNSLPRTSVNTIDIAVYKGDSKDPEHNNVATWDLSMSEAIFRLNNGAFDHR